MPDEAAARSAAVTAHYGSANLSGTLLAALRAAGKHPDGLTTSDLAPVDQFHTGGKGSTLELARLAGLRAGSRVLDVGGGLGGPARTLAEELGCTVTVLDLTLAFCEVGALFSARTGLADRVSFRHGDALNLPFGDASFDVVWMQHCSMNIGDKSRLYGEAHRVLRPDGLLALHEVVAGETSPLHYPVPWAREPSISFLVSAAELRSLLTAAGFGERAWRDTTADAIDWFQKIATALAARPSPPPLGLHLVMGPAFGVMVGNLQRNLQEGRAAVVMGVLDRI